jgi:hypothetical protein
MDYGRLAGDARCANLTIATNMLIDSLSRSSAIPARLRPNKRFQPCLINEGEELFANGIFEFNITRILAFLDADPARFPVELTAVATIVDYGSRNLDEATILAANLSRPILLAEIAPGRYNPIDGNHRIAKARRDSVVSIPARRIGCPEHVPFLTSTLAFESYVEYWNSKIKETRPGPRRVADNPPEFDRVTARKPLTTREILERETRLELATSTLARLRSTN